ncbi:hypothetical protein SGLAM104S_01258 [Streptomyces glaucescens]
MGCATRHVSPFGCATSCTTDARSSTTTGHHTAHGGVDEPLPAPAEPARPGLHHPAQPRPDGLHARRPGRGRGRLRAHGGLLRRARPRGSGPDRHRRHRAQRRGAAVRGRRQAHHRRGGRAAPGHHRGRAPRGRRIALQILHFCGCAAAAVVGTEGLQEDLRRHLELHRRQLAEYREIEQRDFPPGRDSARGPAAAPRPAGGHRPGDLLDPVADPRAGRSPPNCHADQRPVRALAAAGAGTRPPRSAPCTTSTPPATIVPVP